MGTSPTRPVQSPIIHVMLNSQGQPLVLIIGGGFAGLSAARGLARAPARVLLVDRRNYHLFQPLLYQVATASLSPADISAPIRSILKHQRNCDVALAEVTAIDVERRIVTLSDPRAFAEDGAPVGAREVGYDYLMVASGATHSYFGYEAWRERAPGLKDIPDATEIRRRFLLAFERAEREDDDARRRARLTFVVVGAGPTGVELAGAMAEIARKSIPKDFRRIDTTTARVVLCEGGSRVLPAYPEELSARAKRDLEALGVEVMVDALVTAMDERGVVIGEGEGAKRIDASCVFWAAGVKASGLGAMLGAPTDKAGRVKVSPDLSIPGRPEVFVAGDLAQVTDRSGGEVPGVAPAAMQMGRHVARVIRGEAASVLHNAPRPRREPFRYVDKGMLATIGRARAVADVRGRRFAGLAAWALWSLVHIFFLIGFRNRFLVMYQWAWAWATFQRGARLITPEHGDTGA